MQTKQMTIRVLETKEDTMDNSANFPVEYVGFKGRVTRTEAYLFDARDCRQHPGIFVMQRSACLKSHYSAADIMHQEEMNSQEALTQGSIVMYDGELYMVKINGNFSDMGVLVPLTNCLKK